MRKLISILLTAALIAAYGTVVAKTESEIFLKEDFENRTINVLPDGYKTSAKSDVRVVESDGSKKLLLNSANAEVSIPAASAGKRFTLQADIERDTSDILFSVGIMTAGGKSYLVKSEGAGLYTFDGEYIGGLNATVNNIIISFDVDKLYYNVSVNGRQKIYHWKSPKNATGCIGVVIKKESPKNTRGGLYVDNLYLYEGFEILNDLPHNDKSDEAEEYVDVDFSSGDFSFFNSNFINGTSKSYAYTAVNQKLNEVHIWPSEELLQLDRRQYIEFDKITDDDSHIDITCNRSIFDYYVVRGYVKVPKFGPTVHFAIERQYAADGIPQIDTNILTINPTGKMVLNNGAVVKSLNTSDWTYVEIAYDFPNHTADVWVDHEKVAANYKINENVKQIDMNRIWVNGTGRGNVCFQDYEVIGLQNKYEEGDKNWGSVFNSDEGLREYLKNKTAFHAIAGTVSVDGVRMKSDIQPYYDNAADELYVPAQMLQLGYGIDAAADANKLTANGLEATANSALVTYHGKEYTMSKNAQVHEGQVMVPIREFAEKVLGKYVLSDGYGMIITADQKINFNLEKEIPEILKTENKYSHSYLRSLNWYLFFERPTAAQLRSEWEKVHGGLKAQHPRLYCTADDINNIKKLRTSHEIYATWVERVLSSADALLDSETEGYYYSYSTYQMLDQARAVLNKMEHWGLAYQLTGDRKYSDRAWNELEAVGKWPDWNPIHALDHAEMEMAYAIGYDLMYDAFSQEQRDKIWEIVSKKGMTITRGCYYGRIAGGYHQADETDRFAKWKSNFNTVINSGGICAAIAFAEYDPDMCFDMIEKGIRSLEYTCIGFEPGGAWCEGATYWNYLVSYLARSMPSLVNNFGTEFGLMYYQGMENMGYFLEAMSSAQGTNPFHDAVGGKSGGNYLNFVGKFYNQPELIDSRQRKIINGASGVGIWDLIWTDFEPEKTLEDLNKDLYFRGLDAFSFRESYTDTDGLYLSAHGGAVGGYHAQADVGTYVFDLGGYRWAEDLGREDYAVQGQLPYYWAAYRRRPESHNCIVFDPDELSGMNDNGMETLSAYESKERGAYIVYNMQNVYRDKVSDYIRGFYVGDDRRSFTLRDEFTTKKDSDSYWFLCTRAEPRVIDDRTIVLRQGTVECQVKFDIQGAETAELSFGAAKPLETSPVLSGQDENKGYSRVALHFTTKGKVPVSVTAKYSLLGETASDTALMTMPISEWSIPDGELPFRENLSLRNIYVNDRDISDVAPDGTVRLAQGAEVPVITAASAENGKRVEVVQAQKIGESAVIRVYSDDGSQYRETTVPIQYVKVDEKMAKYTECSISEVSVSETPESWNGKDGTIDNDFTTRWTCNSIGATAIFALDSLEHIGAISVAEWQGNRRIYSFEIEVSADGINWTSVLDESTSGESESLEVFEFEPINARYVKYINKGNSINTNSNIVEFRVLKTIQ